MYVSQFPGEKNYLKIGYLKAETLSENPVILFGTPCILGISQVYHVFISDIPQVNLRNIFGISQVYLGFIKDISLVYLGYFSGISQAYLRHISVRCISCIFPAYIRHT